MYHIWPVAVLCIFYLIFSIFSYLDGKLRKRYTPVTHIVNLKVNLVSIQQPKGPLHTGAQPPKKFLWGKWSFESFFITPHLLTSTQLLQLKCISMCRKTNRKHHSESPEDCHRYHTSSSRQVKHDKKAAKHSWSQSPVPQRGKSSR